ncbi:dachshund homolog 1 isoform X2 [Tribolium castaneum]|uniref:dachshund homolog 1 isoform X2 n=1 Tax=Tribolium castaneum TaxID=7070 RepID=UPI00077DEF62|nr:PREDICTED: dachshund homolog 1 isoform X2 [Tribolium castaneum]|eukprot:XP_015834661.1 PREDICTED: dachshund homolog 1 isoform X2 [Tribolium castaneum]
MDNSGMDSASEHSSHASSGSPAVAVKPSPSPPAANSNTHQVHSPRQASPLGPPMSMAHPLSPPPVSSASLARSMALGHLPPPGLGLLNSLGVLHSPLDLMAHHAPPRSYNSPPPISTSDPTANECKLVDYRGQKVAAFIIAGDTMLCLPQAFELFLKHLVGGLHTVYTKLKRLDIVPLVCNVEQVRILRGLGAIQPGVNRCKLLSCKDFDTLYRDCTTARPGRPPKRAPVGLSLAASHLQQQQLKKQRLDNGDYPYENGHMGAEFPLDIMMRRDMSRLEKSPLLANGYNHPPHLSHMQFMQLPHPAAAHSALLSPAMPHNLTRHDGSVIKNQGMPTMEAIARSGIWENCRAAYEDIVKHLERLREERCDPDRPLPLDQKARDLSPRNGSPTDHSPVLNLSKSGGGSAGSLGDGDHSGSEADGPDVPPSPRSPRSAAEDEDDDNISDPEDDDDKDQDMDEGDLPLPAAPGGDSQQAALNYSTLASAVASANGPSQDPSISSTETLLRNIQGLLKVAADNARQQERQINYEKAELKMDVLREREVKDSLERQLVDEQKMRALVQKRLRRERRARRRLQDQLEAEVKRRTLMEEALKAAGAAEQLRIINEKVAPSEQKLSNPKVTTSSTPNQSISSERERVSERVERMERERVESPPPAYGQQTVREPPPPPPENKPWGYSGIDLMNTGAAFWQNYSESLAQELELERKSRQQQVERDVKSPLQDRSGYYKNSMLFTSTAT